MYSFAKKNNDICKGASARLPRQQYKTLLPRDDILRWIDFPSSFSITAIGRYSIQAFTSKHIIILCKQSRTAVEVLPNENKYLPILYNIKDIKPNLGNGTYQPKI